METITSESSRTWLDRRSLKLDRYLRRFHKKEDRPFVFNLLYYKSPDEGKKLIANYNLSEAEKLNLLVNYLLAQSQITCLIFGDQRSGKDALICEVFEMVVEHCKLLNIKPPRMVTLGNIRKPPFVADEDMYFSFKSIPAGSSDQDIWIYCSEIETVLPSREGSSPENKLFSQLEGTLAQNHQKLFGCVKLASKVDINALRSCNCKLFKFIAPEKLNIENVERANIVSPLGNWLLPRNPNDKSECLMAFDNQLFTVHIGLPSWWSSEYSEQFRDVPLDKINDYVEVVFSNGMNIQQIQIAVSQKFRTQLSREDIEEILGAN
jgi:hypothetical protein